jgi:hypothetical protein
VTPVLVVAHRRVETTRAVVNALLGSGAEDVWAFVDAPRSEAENVQVSEVAQLLRDTEWPGEFHFRSVEENLGVARAVPAALDWVFHDCKRAVILEDDCLPTPEFLSFADLMLDRYDDDPRVGVISGTRIATSTFPRSGLPYDFSMFPLIWGWATWKTRWENYSHDVRGWRRHVGIRELLRMGGPLHAWDWTRLFNSVASDDPWSWDYQLTYMLWRHRQVAVIPGVDLVKNIGFGDLASHTADEPSYAPDPPPDSIRTAALSAAGDVILRPEANRALDGEIRRLLFSPSIGRRIRNRLPWAPRATDG